MPLSTDTLKCLADCLRSESNECFDQVLAQTLQNLADRIDAVIDEANDPEINPSVKE